MREMSSTDKGRAHGLGIVLVHGGWHCSSSWGRVVPALQARGHVVVAPDLPAHGWRARHPEGYFAAGQPDLATTQTAADDTTLEMAADVVIDALRAVRAASSGDRAAVVVSHSSSGSIVSRAAERAPELIDHLVYVAAIVPSRLRSAMEVGALPEYGSQTMDGLVVGDPAITATLRINPRSSDPGYRDLLRRKFYGDVPPEVAAAFIELLCPDQPLSYLADPVSVSPSRWGSLPRTYVKTTEDSSIAPAVQDIMIADADALTPQNRFRQVTIDTGHCPFASRPEELADIITAVAPRAR